ncbi:sodium/solute symporter [Chitinophagaceae bacterium LB-8]|uniref:Sodium/solute symporter n=1 Tax=Paraflavisolibacter caeni TaxID=2982496 RepID=A0A9X2XQ38_9BACT|nr:sodium/solute symporter [Paraflavisolibacter caeni]MCU7552554.1 sodium/solute symporter [Paraflavisolibacter caeni]
MNVSLATLDYLVLLIYLVALFIIGFVLSKNKSQSGSDIFLGGRSLKWWQIGFSLFSANAGPMMLIGFASIGFSQGVVGSNFEWLAWIFLLLLAMFFLPHYLSTKVTTMPQFLLLRFGRPSYNFLVIYSLLSILVVWLGCALYAGGLIISQIFDWPLMSSVVLIGVIASSFTAIGGLKAVVRTGIFQSLIIILSSVILTYLALQKIGGVSNLANALPAHYWKLFRPASDPEYSWIAIIAGYPVVAIFYWCTDQTIVQKVLAAKSLKEGQYGAMFIAALKIIMPLIFIFPGIMCFVLYKDIAQPDNAYITLVKQLMPHGLLGLCIAALIAALIDTVSSGLNSFSTVFTLDVVARLMPMDENAKRRMGKWLTLLAAVLAIGIAFIYSKSGKGFFELSQGLVSILAPPLSVVFLAGVTWKRANSIAAEVVLYGGGLLCLAVGICHVLNYPSKEFWPHFLLLSVYLFLGLAAVMVVVSLLTKPNYERSLPSLIETNRKFGHSSKQVWLGWGLLALVMAGIYLVFS